jgi:hypothetical protein
MVGVRDRPDAGPPRQRGRPAPGDPGQEAVDDRQGDQRPAPGGGHGGGGPMALDEEVDRRP